MLVSSVPITPLQPFHSHLIHLSFNLHLVGTESLFGLVYLVSSCQWSPGDGSPSWSTEIHTLLEYSLLRWVDQVSIMTNLMRKVTISLITKNAYQDKDTMLFKYFYTTTILLSSPHSRLGILMEVKNKLRAKNHPQSITC